MFYNRALATAFAEDFWDRPCKSDKHKAALGLDEARDVPLERVWDQRKAPADSFEPHFVFDKDTGGKENLYAVPKKGAKAKDGSALDPVLDRVLILGGDKLDDCAHFLSRCLIAGGVPIKEQWSVPMLLIALREGEDQHPRPIAKTLADNVPLAAAQSVIDAGLLHIGDMIGYFSGGYQHSAMFTGVFDHVGRVTCHTRSRFVGHTPKGISDAWHLDSSSYTFTLMHILGNHPPPLGDAIAGWWKVVGGRQTEFFFVTADGRAIRTVKEPKSAKAAGQPAAGDSRGYWFFDQKKAQFCWRIDGRVDELTPDADRASNIVVGDFGVASATQM